MIALQDRDHIVQLHTRQADGVINSPNLFLSVGAQKVGDIRVSNLHLFHVIFLHRRQEGIIGDLLLSDGSKHLHNTAAENEQQQKRHRYNNKWQIGASVFRFFALIVVLHSTKLLPYVSLHDSTFPRRWQ